MCRIDQFPIVNQNGMVVNERKRHRCGLYRPGQKCPATEVFHHPISPRSTTPNRSSGDESTGSSGHRRRRREQQPQAQYVNPATYVFPSAPAMDRRRSYHAPAAPIVIVDGASSPSRHYAMPRTAPPSPNLDQPHHHRRMSTSGYRPVIVDDRRQHLGPGAPIIITNNVPGHRRTPSSSSHHSRGSSSASEEAPRYTYGPSATTTTLPHHPRRRSSYAAGHSPATEEALRQMRIDARVQAANAEIKNRPTAPMPPSHGATPAYIRPAVEVRSSLRAPRYPAMTREQRERMRQEEEDEAQRQRLRDRMTPQRRNSVSGGAGGRTRVMYTGGGYRRE